MDFDTQDEIVLPRRRYPRVIEETDNGEQWIGRRGSPLNPAQVPVGFAYAPNLVSPNDYDVWDVNSTTDLSGVPDVTARVQAAHDQAAAAGYGGVIQLPPGLVLLNGLTISAGGIWLRGSPAEFYTVGASPAQRGKRGTFILTSDPTKSAVTLTNAASNTVISDLGFIQPQPQEQSGWSIGAITLRDIAYATFTRGMEINNPSSLVIDNVNFLSDLLAGSPNQQSALQVSASNSAMMINQPDKALITNCEFKGVYAGIILQGTYASAFSRIKLSDLDFDGCVTGILEEGTNIAFNGSGLSCKGLGSALFSQFLESLGTNPIIDLDMLIASQFAGYGVQIAGSGVDIRFGPNLWIDNWNMNPSLILGGGNQAAIKAIASNTVRYSSGCTRFTNANAGSNTGGTGTFTTY